MVTTATKRQQAAELKALVKHDPAVYRSILQIDADGGLCRLSESVDPWQDQDYRAVDPAARRVAGQDIDAPYQRFWLCRGRGHSKTTDIAVTATWMLYAATRMIRGVVCAGDEGQAGLTRDAIARLLKANPWLAETLEVQKLRVINRETGSSLEILSSDAPTSYGLLVDFAICDEITHWPSRALWDSIFSASAKRRHCLLLVIANAGFRDHWSAKLHDAIKCDRSWYYHRLDGPVASWISKEHLEEQQRLLLDKEYRRLWLNQEIDSDGESLSLADVQACTTLGSGPKPARPDRIYCAGLDLGIRHDHSAFVVVACDTYRHAAEVISVESWRPSPGTGGKVCIASVHAAILDAHKRYGLHCVLADPNQAEYLVQLLANDGVPISTKDFTSTNINDMSRALVDGLRNRQLLLIDDDELRRDLLRLRIKSDPFGKLKLTAISDESGHADRAFALAMIAPEVLTIARSDIQISPAYEENDRAEVLCPV
jgi:hypothetical protein